MNSDAIGVSDGVGWDEYVLNHSDSSFYHLFGWKTAFEDVFNFRTFYLEAKESGKIRGILPLVLVKTCLGKKLVSIPIGVHAGVLSDNEAIAEELIKKAETLTKELDCSYLELRNAKKRHKGLPTKELYVTFVKDLPLKTEECLSRMPRKARAAARHAIESGLSYNVGPEYLDRCYEIYAVNQKNLGSPVVPKKWFKKLAEIFKDRVTVLAVKNQKQHVASVLTFFHKDTILPFYGGCIPKSFRSNVNNYMYLKLQEYAVEKGYKVFDFGRSRIGVGSYHFKINQGFTPTQLYYECYLNRPQKIPDISPSNKLFGLAQVVWKRLPLSFTNWLGPKVFKYVIP